MSDSTTPKIIVDDDWKSQARAEKERLAAAEKQRAAEAAPAAGASAAPQDPRAAPAPDRLPPADFNTLLGSMITQALMYMGAFPDPETGQAVISLEHAKFHIDLLGVIEAKTKGNLTEAESRDLAQSLSQLRLQFVEVTKVVAQHVEKRQASAGKFPQRPDGGG
ncbi:MAG: DUF1844 domain-containing protein [Phycisphaerales bacterium]